jgi:hypothetical protein
LDLRKGKAGESKALYTVLEQQQASVGQGNIMGSDHTYVIPGAEKARGGTAGAALKKCAPLAPCHPDSWNDGVPRLLGITAGFGCCFLLAGLGAGRLRLRCGPKACRLAGTLGLWDMRCSSRPCAPPPLPGGEGGRHDNGAGYAS